MKTPLEILKFFSNFIFNELGITYQEANFYQLETRLNDICKQLGFKEIESLYQNAKNGMNEQMRLLILDIATNNETLFFRDPALFTAIEKIIVSKEQSFLPHQQQYRIWSAACSFGQEVYTLVMLFDQLKTYLPNGKYEILATDVSETALKVARLGQYSQLQVQRGLTTPQLLKNFEKISSDEKNYVWQVKPELKKNVTFQSQNLTKPFMNKGNFDLILCRNVLIYQTLEKKKEIIARLREKLNPNGFLVLGASESLIGISNEFEMIRAEKATLYQKSKTILKAG